MIGKVRAVELLQVVESSAKPAALPKNLVAKHFLVPVGMRSPSIHGAARVPAAEYSAAGGVFGQLRADGLIRRINGRYFFFSLSRAGLHGEAASESSRRSFVNAYRKWTEPIATEGRATADMASSAVGPMGDVCHRRGLVGWLLWVPRP